MRALFFLVFFACSLPAAFSQNSCYNDLLAAGNKHLNAGRYDKAIQQYEAAMICGDKPANGDGVLKSKIAAARQQKKEKAEQVQKDRETAEMQQAAEDQMEEFAWQKVLSHPSPLSYQYFLDKFPKAKHSQDASQKIAAIQAQFSLTKCSYCPEMVFVKGGPFIKGDMSKHLNLGVLPPAFKMESFEIGKYEITNQQFCVFLNEEADKKPGTKVDLDGGNFVMIKLSADDQEYAVSNFIIYERDSFLAKPGFEKYPVFVADPQTHWIALSIFSKYATWLSTKTGVDYRMPSHLEWEYAARGGPISKGYRYSGSNIVDEVAWLGIKDSYCHHQVGQKRPNELGIYDMSGNVHESVIDYTTNGLGKLIPSQFNYRGGGCSTREQITVYDIDTIFRDDLVNLIGVRLVRCANPDKCGGGSDKRY